MLLHDIVLHTNLEVVPISEGFDFPTLYYKKPTNFFAFGEHGQHDAKQVKPQIMRKVYS